MHHHDLSQVSIISIEYVRTNNNIIVHSISLNSVKNISHQSCIFNICGMIALMSVIEVKFQIQLN